MKMLKKMFSRRNVVLTIGGLLILSGVLVWVINFSFINVKTAKADADPGNSSDPGHFSEDWTATEIFGVYLWDNNTDDSNITIGVSSYLETALGRINGTNKGSAVYTLGGGTEKAGVSYGLNDTANNRSYRLSTTMSKYAGGGTPTVTKWHVDGHMHN